MVGGGGEKGPGKIPDSSLVWPDSRVTETMTIKKKVLTVLDVGAEKTLLLLSLHQLRRRESYD